MSEMYERWIPVICMTTLFTLLLVVISIVVAIIVFLKVRAEYLKQKALIKRAERVITIASSVMEPVHRISTGSARVIEQVERIAVGGLRRIADKIDPSSSNTICQVPHVIC